MSVQSWQKQFYAKSGVLQNVIRINIRHKETKSCFVEYHYNDFLFCISFLISFAFSNNSIPKCALYLKVFTHMIKRAYHSIPRYFTASKKYFQEIDF